MYTRTQALIGEFAMNLIKDKKVFIFGVGGVGGYVAEALARSGVGTIAVADFDTIEESNFNRQIIADKSTIGKNKAEVMAKRMMKINDKIVAKYLVEKVDAETVKFLSLGKYDYVIDCIDDVQAKVAIIKNARENKIPVISCMGTGNKLHPEMLKVDDISKSKGCPLAKAVRKALKEEGITKDVKVVYSEEAPIVSGINKNGRTVPASAVFVPAAAGILIAAEVFRSMAYIDD